MLLCMGFLRVLPLVAPVFALSSCLSQERPEPPLQLASTPVSETATAVDRLATGRCLGAERCAEIGADSRLRDFEHCLAVMRNEAERELDFCRETGINGANVQKCSTEWATEDCEGSTAPLSAVASCTHENICMR